jgi:hypothetical protein
MSFSQYADMAKAATKTDPPRRISHSGGPIWRLPLSMDDHTKRDARKFRDNLRNQAIALIDLERGLPELLNECNRHFATVTWAFRRNW